MILTRNNHATAQGNVGPYGCIAGPTDVALAVLSFFVTFAQKDGCKN